MLGFLLGAFAFVTSAIGLTGLGAVLDAAVPSKVKRRTAEWAVKQTQRLRAAELGSVEFFDRLFGPRIVSVRAIAVSAALSIGTTLIIYVIAHLTSDPETQRGISPIGGVLAPVEIYAIGIYSIAVVVCDFLSYAQTRIFLGALGKLRNLYISAILYMADLMFSMVIFISGYAIARSIVAVSVASTLYAQPFERNSMLSPEVFTAAFTAIAGKEAIDEPEYGKAKAVFLAVERYRSRPGEGTETDLAKSMSELEYQGVSDELARVHTSKIYCLRDLSFKQENSTHIFQILDQTNRLALQKVGLESASFIYNKNPAFYEALSGADPVPGGCRIHVVLTGATISPAAGLPKLTWVDFFLGSTAMTTQQLAQAVTTKLSMFPHDSPVAHAPFVISHAFLSHESPVLGVGAKLDSAFGHVFVNDMNSGNLRIPLGPLALSSMTANILFGMYLFFSVSVSTGLKLFEIPMFSRLLRPSAVFVRISSGFVAVVLGLGLALFAANLAASGIAQFALSHPFHR